MKIDLHIHTNHSDGRLTVEKILDIVKRMGVQVISITDHDTVAAYQQLTRMNLCGVQIIPGIEISARDICSVHILGYNINIYNKELLHQMEKVKCQRIKEIRLVIEKLSQNVDSMISLKDIIKSEKALTRDAVAHYLWKKGFTVSMEEACKKYLNIGACGYVQKQCMSPYEAISLVIQAGGIPVLAHPNRLPLTIIQRNDLIEKMCAAGLKGIEVYCKNMTNESEYVEICKKNNLFITGGSDFHYNEPIGQWTTDRNIPGNLAILQYINSIGRKDIVKHGR